MSTETPHSTTRRAMLATGAGAVALAAPVTAFATPDAETRYFLHLEATARDLVENTTGNTDRSDEALDAALDQLNHVERLILETPASTATAARVKVSVLARWAESFQPTERDFAGFQSVMETLRRAGAMQ